MKIAKVELVGVRGVADLSIGLLPRQADDGQARDAVAPFVVTGPSGSGKTRLLEALCAAKEFHGGYGVAPDERAWFREGAVGGRVTIQWDTDAAVEAPGELVDTTWDSSGRAAERPSPLFRERLARWEPGPQLPKIEYLHAERLADIAGWKGERPSPLNPAHRLRRVTHKYDWVRGFLSEETARAAERTRDELEERGIALAPAPSALDGFAVKLGALTDRLRFSRTKREGAGTSCWFVRRGGEAVELSELALGEQALVLFAAAFERLGLDRSVVLIDSPEVALHPEDHARVFQGLVTLCGGGQLIAATTSPAILRSMPRERILVLS